MNTRRYTHIHHKPTPIYTVHPKPRRRSPVLRMNHAAHRVQSVNGFIGRGSRWMCECRRWIMRDVGLSGVKKWVSHQGVALGCHVWALQAHLVYFGDINFPRYFELNRMCVCRRWIMRDVGVSGVVRDGCANAGGGS